MGTHVTELDLEVNAITDDSMESLAMVLKQNRVLRTLNLSYNKVGDKGARLLAGALRVNSVLSFVNLQYNCIGEIVKKELEVIVKERKEARAGPLEMWLGRQWENC